MIMGNLHLVTGYAGEEHITSNDQGSFNAALMGTGEFVLERGRQFEAQVISNNTVRIFDGDLLMQGRHIRLKEDTYVDLLFENGMQGYKRTDLIAVRYEKDSITSIESASLVVIKGIQTEDTYVSPEKITGDIISEHALQNDTILYKVNFDGLSIQEPEKVFTTVPTLETMKEEAIGQIAEEAEKAIQNLRGIVQTEFATLVNTLMGEKLAKAVVIAETIYTKEKIKTWGVNSRYSYIENWGFYKLGKKEWNPFYKMNSFDQNARYPFDDTSTQYLLTDIKLVCTTEAGISRNINELANLDCFLSYMDGLRSYRVYAERRPDNFRIMFSYKQKNYATSPWITAAAEVQTALQDGDLAAPTSMQYLSYGPDYTKVYFRMIIVNLYDLFSQEFLDDPDNGFISRTQSGIKNGIYYSTFNYKHIPVNDAITVTSN